MSVILFNISDEDYVICEASSSLTIQQQEIVNKNHNFIDCLYCGKSFHKKDMPRHKIEEEKTLHCNYCDKSFDVLHVFRRHMYRYHKLYSCDKCNLQFLKGPYEYHMRSVHSNPSQCSVCGKAFATRRSLLTHSKKIHLGQRDTRWKCNFCCYQAPDNYQFSVHLARHKKTPNLVCDQCGARRYTHTELRKHIQIEHLGGYQCNKCNKVFRCSAYLKKHVIAHNLVNVMKNKPVICQECGKPCSTVAILKRHMLTHQNLVQIFRCDSCGKEVSSKQSYLSHMRIHTGVKPFSCNICHKVFAEKRYLKWHGRQHESQRS